MKPISRFAIALLLLASSCSSPQQQPDGGTPPDLAHLEQHAPVLAEGINIPPITWYNGAGSKVGVAFKVQMPTGWTGAIVNGLLTFAAGGTTTLANGSVCDALGNFCWTSNGGISGLSHNGGASADIYTAGASQAWITTTDFSPNPSGGTSLGGTQPFGSITSAQGSTITGGVFISDRGNSVGVFGARDNQQLNRTGIQIVGGTGGNGYALWSAADGTFDTGLVRTNTGELSVSDGTHAGHAGNLVANQLTATTYSGLPLRDTYLDAYDPADNSTSNSIQSWIVTTAATLADAQFNTTVVGVGGGNYVVKICSDGATCSGANLKATLTVSCTAAVGTKTALTVNNSSISASSTLTLQPSTACGTTAESGNFVFHLRQ